MNAANQQVEISALLIEDNPGDRELIGAHISGLEVVRLDTADTLARGMAQLKKNHYDAILLDLNLPDSSGVNTLLKILVSFPEHPVVVLTGFDENELGLLSVQSGAQDYLNKQDLNGRLLLHSLRYAIERNKLMLRLRQSLHEIERLRGLLPICMKCKKIRNDRGYWEQIEKYFVDRSSVKFTHGLCPECSEAFLKESIALLQAAPARR